MTRGRKPSLIPTVQWSIMIPIDLAFQIEAKLMDPITKKAAYSARSKLIQSLLYDWLRAQGTPPLISSDVMCPECKRPKATCEQDVITGSCPKWLWPEHAEAVNDCLSHTQQELPLEDTHESVARQSPNDGLPDELPEGATFNYEPGDGSITINPPKEKA